MNSREMLSYFGLTAVPFTKEISTDRLQKLPSVEANLSAAQLLVETRGIGVITGKAGTGKSSLLRLLCHSLPPGLYKPFYICHSSVGIVEFYTHLVTAFGLQSALRRAAMFRDLKEHILSMNNTSHIHPVLLIDESHLLNNDILAEIRLLTNYQIDSMNALSVILCGAESLNRKFGLSMLESLANSITITISVDSLPKEVSLLRLWRQDSTADKARHGTYSPGRRGYHAYHRNHRQRRPDESLHGQKPTGRGRARTNRHPEIRGNKHHDP